MTGQEFEQLVRQTARWVWNLPEGDGASDFIATQEIDCVCHTADVIHLIECTTQRQLDKVRQDTTSLLVAKQHLEKQGHTVKPWIITLDEPTPDQQAYARNHKISILSESQFRNRILKAENYLNARWSYRFGSAADPCSGSHQLKEEEYVPVPLREVRTGVTHDIISLLQLLIERKTTTVIQGPFGAGKSVTVREVFQHLRLLHFKDAQMPVVVAINLRDPWGQEDTDEALRRHAAKIGFEGRDQLVRAWNGGFVVLLLDGFDELASQAWRIAPANMKKTRYEAVRLVRAFVKENHGRYGILLTGREHYFDTPEEMQMALGLPADATVINIEEFTEEQAQRYLGLKNVKQPLPDWLPRKPLLLGYLASRGLLRDVLSIDGTKGAAHAWNIFIDKICEREALLSKDIEGASVRKLLEILATRSRSSAVGTGPLFESDLSAAYEKITGSEPLEQARMLLQPLPGLTARDQQEGARSFVDVEMLDALRGSALASFVFSPFALPEADTWRHPLGELGYSVTGLITSRAEIKVTAHLAAAKEAVDRWNAPTLAIDCILSTIHRPDVESLDCGGLVIKEGIVDCLDLEQCPVSNIELQWCHINTLTIGDSHPPNVKLYGCIIEKIVGVSDFKGLPSWISECLVGQFDDLNTNAAIMRSNGAMPVRVLLTVLRKLFMQRGRARKESAFNRGLEPNAARFVPPILDVIRKSDIAFRIDLPNGAIWHPNRRYQGRIVQIVSTLGSNGDSLVQAAAKLQ